MSNVSKHGTVKMFSRTLGKGATLKPEIRSPESQVVVLPVQRVETVLNIHEG